MNMENRMDFKAFKENLAQDVKEILDERIGKNNTVEIRTVDKMNQTYDALTIKPENSSIGVNLDVTSLYSEYEDDASYDSILSKSADIAVSALDNRPKFNIDEFMVYAKMKDKLAIQVVSVERNAALLKTVPHKNIEDMAVVYRFIIDDIGEGTGTILITNQMLEHYGITAEQLHVDAVENAPKNRPIVIKGMSEVLTEMMGVEKAEMLGFYPIEPEDERIFVASVPDNVHGAGVLAYPDFMDQAAERVGGDFYILPSSIHELLIVPDTGEMELTDLKNMVQTVNATEVAPEDKLTDSVYHYDIKNKFFELGEKFIERQSATKVLSFNEHRERKQENYLEGNM